MTHDMKCHVQQTSPDERHVGIQGHAVAETPTVAAHVLLYIVRTPLPPFSIYHTTHSILPFITSDRGWE